MKKKVKKQSVFHKNVSPHIQEGTERKGLSKMEEAALNEARTTKGNCGSIQLLSKESPDIATTITLWESEKTREVSPKGVFKDTSKAKEQYVELSPILSNLRER